MPLISASVFRSFYTLTVCAARCSIVVREFRIQGYIPQTSLHGNSFHWKDGCKKFEGCLFWQRVSSQADMFLISKRFIVLTRLSNVKRVSEVPWLYARDETVWYNDSTDELKSTFRGTEVILLFSTHELL